MSASDILNGIVDTGNKDVLENKKVLDLVMVEIIQCVRSRFALKGGYALSKLLENPRLTRDIDFSIENAKEYEEIKEFLSNLGEKLISLGYIDAYDIAPEISNQLSGGVKYKRNGKNLVGIDVGLHQLDIGVHSMTFDVGDCDVFELERMLADKISVVLSEKRFRRIKDVYDIYRIVSEFDLDYKKLKELTDLRLKDHMDYWDNIPFTDTIMEQLEHTWQKFELRSFLNGDSLDKPDLRVMVGTFYKLVSPLKVGYTVERWDHKVGVWV